MENLVINMKRNEKVLNIIATVILAIGAIAWIKSFASDISYYGGYFSFEVVVVVLMDVLAIAGLIGAAVLAQIKPYTYTKYAIMGVAAAYLILFLLRLRWLITAFYFQSFIYVLFTLLVVVIMGAYVATYYLKDKAFLKNMGLFYLLAPVAVQILWMIYNAINGFSLLGFVEFLCLLAQVALGMLVVLQCAPVIVEDPQQAQQTYNQHSGVGQAPNPGQMGAAQGRPVQPNMAMEPEGYKNIGIFVLLCIVTCGIYALIWIYKSTELINKKLFANDFTPTAQLLLCMFVPFYIIYWVYKQSSRIDDALRMQGRQTSDLAVVCLLLTIFAFGIIAYALMQDQINKLVKPVQAGYTVPPQDRPAQPQRPVQPQAKPVEPKKESNEIDDQVETLKKMKALLDEGIITQEDYDAKKKEVLGL